MIATLSSGGEERRMALRRSAEMRRRVGRVIVDIVDGWMVQMV
jgi:hypothetical protein